MSEKMRMQCAQERLETLSLGLLTAGTS